MKKKAQRKEEGFKKKNNKDSRGVKQEVGETSV